MRFRPELVVSALSAISVIVILFDFLYAIDDSAKIAVYAFDAIVVVILATDFYEVQKVKRRVEIPPQALVRAACHVAGIRAGFRRNPAAGRGGSQAPPAVQDNPSLLPGNGHP